MIVEDQSEVVDFLSGSGELGPGPVERIDTHISIMFLEGDRAYKLKRAVRFPYLDFSSPELRRLNCLAEVAVNLRPAPKLYVGVAPVRRIATETLALGEIDLGGDNLGGGEAVDWLVVMRRFDQEALFDRLFRRSAIDSALVTALAQSIDQFHVDAEIRADFGGREGIRRVVDENASEVAASAPAVFDPAGAARLDE